MKTVVVSLLSALVFASAAQATIVCSGKIDDNSIRGTLVNQQGQQMFVIQDAKLNRVQRILLVERSQGKGNFSGMVLDREGMPMEGQEFVLSLRTLHGQRSILNITGSGDREIVELSCYREVDSGKHSLNHETN